VLLRTYRGEIIQTVPMEIPANVTGAVSVLVADDAVSRIEQRETRGAQPRAASVNHPHAEQVAGATRST
jgi:hypothetical protein